MNPLPKKRTAIRPLSFLVTIACLILVSIVADPAIAKTDPPNVVFIYIDDLGFSDVGFMGAEHFSTPHIDKLAAEGMIFTNAYAAAPNCAPSRACLLSGQYGPRHGVYTVANPDRGPSHLRKLIPSPNITTLPNEKITLGELFQSAGYKTGYFGKWHLGEPGSAGPIEQGFDINIGGNTTGTPKGGHFSPYKNPQLNDGPEKEYLTDRLGEEAVEFIHQNHERPFLLMLSHYAVHTPVQSKPAVTANYKASSREHDFNAGYAGMIESVDDSVGKVMAHLSSLNLDRNTVVIFYSDNGGHGKITSCAPLRGSKGMCYEGGIRVPLAIRWVDSIAAKSTCDIPVHGVDFFETFRVMLRADPPDNQPLDGADIMPLCLQREDSQNEAPDAVATLKDRALFWHFPAYLQGKNYSGAPDDHFRARPFGIVRHENWKLIEHFEDNRLELFNLTSDIGETENIADQHPEITKRLSEKMKLWRTETGAPVPVDLNPDFGKPPRKK